MKLNINYIPAVVSALAVSFGLAGAAQANDDLVDRVKEAGVLKVCQIDYPPLNAKEPTTGAWEGLLVEMVEAFGASIEVKVEHVDATWGTVVQNVKTGRCDMSAAATYVTPKRAVEVLFTNTVTEDTQGAFVATDSDFHSYEDLDKEGNVIVVISGSLNEGNAKTIFKNATIKPVVSDRQQTTLLEMASGRADAAFVATVSTLNFLGKNANVKARPVDDSKLFPAPIAWILPKGEYHMREVVNAWLTSAGAKGELATMEAKWMSVD